MKTKKTYRIEYFFEHSNLPGGGKWMTYGTYTCMQKSFAQGAFSVLGGLYGGSKHYRLVDSDNCVVDEWKTGEIQLN